MFSWLSVLIFSCILGDGIYLILGFKGDIRGISVIFVFFVFCVLDFGWGWIVGEFDKL